MKLKKVAPFVGLSILLMSQNANALTGNQLYERCMNDIKSAAHLGCAAYVRGFVDGIGAGLVLGRHNPAVYCPPVSGIDAVQGELIVENFFRNHPGELSSEAGLIAMQAFIQAFPCPHTN